MLKKNKRKTKKITVLIFALLAAFEGYSQKEINSQGEQPSDLYLEISRMDSILFDAFNAGDLNVYEAMMDENVEFYHDKDGVERNRNNVSEKLKQLIQAKANNSYNIRRELLDQSVEVHAIADYGALQTGTHQFYESWGGQSERLTTTARFIHLWSKEDGNWIISRVISFDHQPVVTEIDSNVEFIKLSLEILDTYVGKYQFSPDFVLFMEREGNKLYGVAQGEKVEIRPFEKAKFISVDNEVKLEFNLDSDGKVTSLTMIRSDGEMNAKKIQ